ncbi:MAG: thioredoxin domain-containing protein [Cyclobacteriaceae bacterium]|nr:thioredoxin domain-containing protein [Cyclobacteriaceae bacterium]
MSASSRIPNRLIQSTSPYLLQHAYNPVDWYEWGNDALTKARQEDKPILVSIGYSSCHWCHVMEHECFENADIAALMNEFFVCIKVDREERPDIDQVYMEAVQAMGINGGWPLNVFLTPDQKPFYGGTYFPPPTWAQVLTNIHKAYQSRKNEVIHTADELTRLLAESDVSKFKKQTEQAFNESLQQIYRHLEVKFDKQEGGLEKAPKFIMPSIWLWLLRYHYLTKNPQALSQINLTLKRIFYGGIYDQLGGGFARYSVDGRWFVPHFEKMLYDNTQLISLYSEAYQVTGDQEYKQAVYATVNWLKREMTHPLGGFYSALDADSEGIEGKFYTWTFQEVLDILGDVAGEVCRHFNITPKGNWEHGTNILYRNAGESPPSENLDRYKEKLLQHRNHRIRPGLDNKILSGWNAMAVSALVDAYHAFADNAFLEYAQNAIRFIENTLIENDTLYRSWNKKRSATEGFLEDYSFLIQAYLKLYEAGFDEGWLEKANRFATKVITDFYDQADGFFFYTSKNAEQLVARKKELFDNVIPASNSVMAQNLLWLGKLLDREDWLAIGKNMVDGMHELILNEPNYMSNWAMAWLWANKEIAEIAFVGEEHLLYKNEFRKHFHPVSLVTGTAVSSRLPLLQGKEAVNKTTVYVCYNKTCKQPVHSVKEAIGQMAVDVTR